MDKWTEWVELVAPYGGPTEQSVPPEIKALAAIRDREIATLAARGIVAELRKRMQRV
jgi:hypothetical protein